MIYLDSEHIIYRLEIYLFLFKIVMLDFGSYPPKLIVRLHNLE